MRVPFRKMLGVLGWLAGTLFLLLVIVLGFVGEPSLIHFIRSPRAQEECSQVRVGTSKGEVIGLFERRTPPPLLRYSWEDNTLSSFRRDGACSVQLGPGDKVVSFHFDESQAIME